MDFKIIWEIINKDYASILLGVKNTLIVALVGTVIGLCIGLMVGGIKAIKVDDSASAPVKIIKKIYDVISTIYIEVFRGTPMMIQAVFIYYALLKVLNWTPLIAGMFVISVNTGAYMSEIIRSGIQSVDKGQTEAARSLGMSNIQTMLLVVLPQAIRNAFPAIGNEFIVNIKDSSVLSIITITELMFQGTRIAGRNYRFTETYFVIACVYLTLTLTMSLILKFIEKRMNKTKTSYPQSMTSTAGMKIATQGDSK
ncbi:MAG: amino acid ABC transporter permease [Anaerorhabdus sp.]